MNTRSTQGINAKRLLKNTAVCLSVLVGVFAIFQLICIATGNTYISSQTFRNFAFDVFKIAFIAWGLSFNVPAGRFDFSVGATISLAAIIGGNIALSLGLGAAGLLLCCVVVGAMLGAVSGLAYVLLRLPAMVVSLGIALIFEALSFVLFDGGGIVLIGKSSMLAVIQPPWLYILGICVLVVLIVVANYTRFGYNRRALSGGQSVAVQTGVNEKVNAVICYCLCGAVVAVAGVLILSKTGTQRPVLGLSSIPLMFQGFLPLFVGMAIARYSEMMTGIFVGSIVTALINQGFASLGLPLAAQSTLSAVIWLAFVVVAVNQGKLSELRAVRAWKKSVGGPTEPPPTSVSQGNHP